jgi:hypothetical protein
MVHEVPCSVHPLRVPTRALKICELMNRMHHCLKVSACNYAKYVDRTHCDTVSIRCICQIVVTVDNLRRYVGARTQGHAEVPVDAYRLQHLVNVVHRRDHVCNARPSTREIQGCVLENLP